MPAEQRGSGSGCVTTRQTSGEWREPTPLQRQRLRAALDPKAKHEPNSRFSALDDKGWRADMLAPAYTRNRQHEGAPGVDGQTVADREAYGGERWVAELQEEVRPERHRHEGLSSEFYC